MHEDEGEDRGQVRSREEVDRAHDRVAEEEQHRARGEALRDVGAAPVSGGDSLLSPQLNWW